MVATSPSMRSHSWSVVNSVVMTDPSAFIGVGNERHRRYLQRQALPAHFGKYESDWLGERRGQIAHGDRCIEAGAESTRSNRADLFGGGRVREQGCAFAHRGAAF